jgi:hypothetical protein
VPSPLQHESPRISLAQVVRASALRGIRLGAVVGAVLGVVEGLGALVVNIWSAWQPGYQVPSVVEIAKVLAYIVAATLIMVASCAVIGAVLMATLAASGYRWRRTV